MEYIDILDEKGNITGTIKEKLQAHKDGDWHKTAHIWIINDKNELLLQKRSPSKRDHPNYWDISGAGHIITGENSLIGGIRELKEELGIDIKENDLEFLFTVISIKNPLNREFQDVYLVRTNLDVNEYTFCDAEVSEVKYIQYKELEQMVKNKVEDILMHDEEYTKLFEILHERF